MRRSRILRSSVAARLWRALLSNAGHSPAATVRINMKDFLNYPDDPPRLAMVYIPYPLYFITICKQDRQKILATKDILNAFTAFAQLAESRRNIAVGRFVIMPNHVHFFVRGPKEFELSGWIGLMKQYLTFALRERAEATEPFWQRGFFDHIIRSSESYSLKWQYVRENPVRAGLAQTADEWTCAGEIVPIRHS